MHLDPPPIPVQGSGPVPLSVWPNGRRTLVRTFPGASLRRTGDTGHARVAEHAHDWPLLSVFIAGGYRNVIDEGPLAIGGPSAVFYRRGDFHANQIGPFGHEQLEIEFDPAWLGVDAVARLDRPVRRVGGAVALASRRLLRLCLDAGSREHDVVIALRAFLPAMMEDDARPAAPPWLRQVEMLLDRATAPLATNEVADRLGVSPQWLTEAYRAHTGEGFAEAERRRRAQRAVQLLETTTKTAAAIAAETGFCDQSHLARVVKGLYGCPPVRLAGGRRTPLHEATRRAAIGAAAPDPGI